MCSAQKYYSLTWPNKLTTCNIPTLRPTDTINTAKAKYVAYVGLLVLLVVRMRTHTDIFTCFCCYCVGCAC